MPSIYALLVGINQYPGNPLQGCINDVKAVEQYLKTAIPDSGATQLHIQSLTDDGPEPPTRQGIIDAFRFFEPAGKDDICLFYYSGHGSYAAAPELIESDNGLVQSFVCIDSRTAGGRDLMDKEMSFLIWKTMLDKPDTTFVAITDCCHSGTITKSFLDNSGITDRMASPQLSEDKIENYLGYGEVLKGMQGYETSPEGKLRVRQGMHIHLAASRDNQTSKELNIDGQIRGAFTHFLLKTLYSSGGNISYRELIDRASNLVNGLVRDQQPGINTNGGIPASARNKIFLSGQTSALNTKYLLYNDRQYGWCINGGTIHGITKGDKVIINETLSTKVTSSPRPDCSVVFNKPEFGTLNEQQYVQVIRQPNQALSVSFAPNLNKGIAGFITDAFTRQKPDSIMLHTEQAGQYMIRNNNLAETYITLPGSEIPLFLPVPVHSEADALYFLELLEKLSNWTNLRELFQAPVSNELYTLKLYRDTAAGNYNPDSFEAIDLAGDNHTLYYKQDADTWYQPAFRLSITNRGVVPLWLTNAYLGFDYSISTTYFNTMEIAPGNTVWLSLVYRGLTSDVIKMKLDENFRKLGYTSITEYIKLFLSTKDPVNTDHLKQEGIPLAPVQYMGADMLKSDRGVGPEETEDPGFTWSCETIGFTIVRPGEETLVKPGIATRLNALTLSGHNDLKGKVVLSSSATSARSLNGMMPGPDTAWTQSLLEPLNLNPGTRSDVIADVLEFFDVPDRDVVHADASLEIRFADAGPDAAPVIPVGFDPETGLYYPLGYTDAKGNVIITRLPEETPSDSALTQRSLTGSIKIYFRKVLGKYLGLSYEHPRLAEVRVSDTLEVSYHNVEAELAEAVKKANHITLFVHGIIGDTEGMVKCIRTPDAITGKTLKDTTDLVLAFDYENLNTPLEETARLLKKRLEAIDIKAGSSKQVTIIAHSMGGLISRLFIEKEQGHEVVSRLIMLGTPNNGTPWADVRDLAETLLTFALNGAAVLRPWTMLLAGVGKLVKGVQITLQQMDSETGIYDALNTGEDPGIPYFIVGGNTQSIAPVFQSTDSAVQRLLRRLKGRTAYGLLDKILFKAPNDIAVTNTSITRLDQVSPWQHKPEILIVACDHLNYFNHPEAVVFLQQHIK